LDNRVRRSEPKTYSTANVTIFNIIVLRKSIWIFDRFTKFPTVIHAQYLYTPWLTRARALIIYSIIILTCCTQYVFLTLQRVHISNKFCAMTSEIRLRARRTIIIIIYSTCRVLFFRSPRVREQIAYTFHFSKDTVQLLRFSFWKKTFIANLFRFICRRYIQRSNVHLVTIPIVNVVRVNQFEFSTVLRNFRPLYAQYRVIYLCLMCI